MALQGVLFLLYFTLSMPMGSVPQERLIAQTPPRLPDLGSIKELSVSKGERQRTSEQRAKEKKQEILWKSLRTAEAALQVEKYFRMGPKNPNLRSVLTNIEVPEGSANKEFIRMVAAVAERYTRQCKDVDAVMEALTMRAANGRSQVSNQEIAELVYNQINPKLQQNRDALQLAKREGYFVLTVASQAQYHELYGEDTEEKKSGGRFHRALYIAVAGREVPVIVHFGSTVFHEDTNEIMIHEKQHWINESLIGLGMVESERPSLMTLNKSERNTALLKEEHHRAIKDEVLACLRQGEAFDLKSKLFSELYTHLFAGQPTDKRKEEDRILVEKISDEIDRLHTLLTSDEHLRSVMVYVLMSVKLRRFPEYLASMRELLKGVDMLEEASQGEEMNLDDVGLLPLPYRKDHDDLLDARFEIDELLLKSWQARSGFAAYDNTRSFLALREEIRALVAKKVKSYKAITRGGVFPPYLAKTYDSGLSGYEQSREQYLRTDILETLNDVSDSTVQRMCEMRSASEEALVIAEQVRSILGAYNRKEVSITFSVAEKGVLVNVHYLVENQEDEFAGAETISQTYVLTRSRRAGFLRTPRARERDFDDAIVLLTDPIISLEETAPAVRQTRAITDVFENAASSYAEACEYFHRAVADNDHHASLVSAAQNVQWWGNRVKEARQAFFRHGVHLPDVLRVDGGDLWNTYSVSDPVSRAAEGLRNALFDIASTYPQEMVNDTIDDEDAVDGIDGAERIQKQFDELIGRRIGRHFGAGVIKNIRCSGVYIGTKPETLGLKVRFEARRSAGGFLPASVDVILHRTVL